MILYICSLIKKKTETTCMEDSRNSSARLIKFSLTTTHLIVW